MASGCENAENEHGRPYFLSGLEHAHITYAFPFYNRTVAYLL